MSNYGLGWSGADYDTWRTGYPPEWDAPDPEPVLVEMTFMKPRQGGHDEIRAFIVRGQWVAEAEEFWEGTMTELDNDGIEVREIEAADPESQELWTIATNMMVTGKYEEVNYL